VRPKPATTPPDPTTLAALTADPQNRRTHDARNLDAITTALQEVGAARSIVIDEDNVILAGNGVTQAAQAAGLTKVRVIEAAGDEIIAVRRRGLTDAQKRALAIYDNRTAELATWNVDQLRADLDAGLDLSAFWNADELTALLAPNGGPKGGQTDPDAVPEVRATDIVRGDLFELGAHRLLCGDSTDAADVARVMGEDRAGLMNTDPPYGVTYANDERPNPGVAKPRVANDALSDAALQGFLESVFRTATTAALADNAAWYLWHAHLTQGFFAAAAAAAAAANVVLHRQIIWVKPVLLLGRGQYHWKHEPCYMGWVQGHQPPDYGLGHGERTQTTVWEIASVTQAERKEFNHSTPKPVGLFTTPIVKHLQLHDIAYEPFAGSGPQFIAAEQLDRRCYGLDLEPSCCQVILDRWEAFTGQRAVKVGEAVRAQETHGQETAPAPRPPKAAAQTGPRRRGYDGRPRRSGA
jgi:DNA modification methylase